MTTRELKAAKRLWNGKPVYDSTNEIDLAISEQDRKKGIPNDPNKCAAAISIKRQFDGCIDAWVYRSVIMVEYGDKVVRYFTSSALRDQQLRYDASGDSKSFDVSKPFPLLAVPRSAAKQHAAGKKAPVRKPKKAGRTTARKTAAGRKPATKKRVRREVGRPTFRWAA